MVHNTPEAVMQMPQGEAIAPNGVEPDFWTKTGLRVKEMATSFSDKLGISDAYNDYKELQWDPYMSQNGRRIAGCALAVITSPAVLAACSKSSDQVKVGPTTTSSSTTSTTEATTTTTPEVCAPTWKIERVNRGDNPRWFPNGIEAIGQAHNAPTEEAREAARGAAFEWFGEVKKNPEMWTGAMKWFKNAQGLEELGAMSPEQLEDADGCATPQAAQFAAQFEAFLADPRVEIAPAIAPKKGRNSGALPDGTPVVSAHDGVSGDEDSRKALGITFTSIDGVICTTFVMERCGQIVTITDCGGRPPEEIIVGKTDDDILPGDGTPAAQDGGTPDIAGQGPAGQPVDPETGCLANGSENCPAEDNSSESEDDSSESSSNSSSSDSSSSETPETLPDDEQPETPEEGVTTTTEQANNTDPGKPQV